MAYKIITDIDSEPVSVDEARLQFKAGSDTSEDGLVAIWIAAAREIAEHYIGRSLASKTVEMALDRFPGGLAIWPTDPGLDNWQQFRENWRTRREDLRTERDAVELDVPPVASITSVKYTDTAGVEQTLATSAYSLSLYGDACKLTPTSGNSWPATLEIADAVRIRYVTGYTACPNAVKAAILLMVAWFNEHRGEEMDENDIQPPAAKSLLNTVKSWAR